MPRILPGLRLSGGISGKCIFFKYVLCFVLNNRDREEDKALLSKEHLVTRDLRLKSGPCFAPQSLEVNSLPGPGIFNSGRQPFGIYGLEWRPHCRPSKAYELSRRSSAEARERELGY